MALDFDTLSATEADLPESKRERKSAGPFTQWLADSYSEGTGRAVTVPAPNVAEVIYLIRRAADELGIGSRVVITNSKKEVVKKVDPKSRGHFTVTFAGKDRKQRKTTDDDTTDESSDES